MKNFVVLDKKSPRIKDRLAFLSTTHNSDILSIPIIPWLNWKTLSIERVLNWSWQKPISQLQDIPTNLYILW